MSNLKDAQKMQKMAEEIKDILEFDDYGIYEKEDFGIKQEEGEGVYTVDLKIRDVEFQFLVRFKNAEKVNLEEDDANDIEINMYEDYWEDVVTYNYTAKKLILMLLFDAVGR